LDGLNGSIEKIYNPTQQDINDFIVENIGYSKMNRFSSAKNQMFSLKELEDFLIAKITK
jgi:hypothetical protein